MDYNVGIDNIRNFILTILINIDKGIYLVPQNLIRFGNAYSYGLIFEILGKMCCYWQLSELIFYCMALCGPFGFHRKFQN